MRVALTHNLKISDSVDEAEFDSPETIDALAASLARQGHEVERIEVSGPASRVVARLEALSPDLIFNTAEGRQGRTREAFYPALFEELGFPYTGSDAYTLCLTLDKTLTKRHLAAFGIPMPRSRLVTRATIEGGVLEGITFPVIVKPNFEGSSKGILADSSVCEDEVELGRVVDRELARFESGLIVERYVRGIDVSCAFVDGVGVDGVIEPMEYVIDPQFAGAYNLYDYLLKNALPDHVTVRTPAAVPPQVHDRVMALTRRILRALDLKDLARCDFRVAQNGEVYFLEANALPSLEPAAGLFRAAQNHGVDFDGVIRCIVRSACRRQGLMGLLESTPPRRSKRTALRVGLTFNVKRIDSSAGDDAEAEFDPPTTIEAITRAIESYGHTVIPLEANAELPHTLAAASPDAVFNIAEGIRGRNREAQVPALCELLGIPFSGSDSTTLSVCLDKGLTKQILRSQGIDTPEWQVLVTGREKLRPFRFPVIVKPNAEGTSKGITAASVVEDAAGVRAAARVLIERYGQPALVEEYITGREFTVGLLGERRPRMLPPMEVVFVDPPAHPVYGFAEKQADTAAVRFECPATLAPPELKRIEKVVKDTFAALACRDVARIDLRMASDGRVYVLEINPLPGLTPDFSDLCVIAKVAGMDHRTLIGEILSGCLKRLRDVRAASALASAAASNGGSAHAAHAGGHAAAGAQAASPAPPAAAPHANGSPSRGGEAASLPATPSAAAMSAPAAKTGSEA